jgi:hypothetical protein
MAWINGQWVEDTPGFGGGYVERDLGWVGGQGFTPGFGGMLGGFGGDVERDLGGLGPPYVPPTGQQPIYDRGGVQPSSLTPYQPTQWAGPNATYPNWDDPAGSFANDVALINMGQPTTGGGMLGDVSQWNPVQQSVQTPQFQPLPDMRAMAEARARAQAQASRAQASGAQAARARAAARMPAVGIRPDPVGVNLDSQFPTIGDGWPRPDPELAPTDPLYPVIDGPMIFDPPPDWRSGTDHEFNVQQREKTKRRLATARGKTKAHLANLRAKGVSKKTIAKAKVKAKGRYAKIKGQSLRRSTIVD